MENGKTSSIIKEFYDIAAPLLAYESCERSVAIERNILVLLCGIQKNIDLIEDCWKCIEEAGCLQSCSDGVLLGTSASERYGVAFEIKMDVLSENKINKPKKFDETLFVDSLREMASAGKKNACKLLAYINWLGEIVPQNTEVALTIWKMLAAYGDWASIEALVYAYGSIGDEAQRDKWEHVLNILRSVYERFSPIALGSQFGEYSEEEVQLANLILFVKQKVASQRDQALNRQMLHYVLEGRDDYKTKMERLSAQTNYFFVLHQEDRYANKKFGF